MAWNTIGTLKGPMGLQGLPGLGIDPTGTTIDASGNLIVKYTDGTTNNLGRVVGVNGVDGKSVSIQGSVANAAALPTTLTSADKGKAYITADNGHLWIWDGTQFMDVGTVQGPKGDTGAMGLQGVPGTKWFTGSGVPSANIAGSRPGDLYLDVVAGDIYVLS